MKHSEKRYLPNQRKGQRMHGAATRLADTERRGSSWISSINCRDEPDSEGAFGFITSPKLTCVRAKEDFYFQESATLQTGGTIQADTAETVYTRTMFCNPTIFWIMRINEFVQ